MPMQGEPITAGELREGDVIPVQIEGGGLEPRTVRLVLVRDGTAMVSFRDGTTWAWEADHPILALRRAPA